MAIEQTESNPNVKTFKHTQRLKCLLTDAELLEKGEELARTLDEVVSLEDEKKAITEQFKSKITELESRSSVLRSPVRNKYDFRPVDCIQTMDNNEGTSKTVRLDTGDIVEERKLTYDERQGNLFDEKPEAEKADEK